MFRYRFAAAAAVFLLLTATSSIANAACTPTAVDATTPAPGSTVTCTGATSDQNSGTGYGTGDQTGITLNVSNGATLAGSDYGIRINDSTVNVGNGASVTGTTGNAILFGGSTTSTVVNSGTISSNDSSGIYSYGANLVVTNSGGISGGGAIANGIYSSGIATVTNNAGATISGAYGISAFTGVTVINSGDITGSTAFGTGVLVSPGDASGTVSTLTNTATGIITAATAVNISMPATIVNSGTITGTAGYGVLTAFGALSLTNNTGGSISGTINAIFAQEAGASVWNAGTISGGTNAIRFTGTGNTLTLTSGSVITGNVLGGGSDTLQLGGTGSATFDVSQLGSTAQYRGFLTFNKIDTSLWTLTGTSTVAGLINVNGGTLSVNGDISSSSLTTVNASGTLGGNGIVGNTTIDGGTLAPGNSIGLLTVQGNLVMTSASTYMVEVSPTNADRVNVTGTANLGGATVNASFANGSYVATQYTILNATGGLGGSTFSTLVNTNLPSNFKSGLSYDANNAYLNLTLDFTPTDPSGSPGFGGGLNGNQGHVANALTSYFNRTGGIPLVFGSLDAKGLSQVAGELAPRSQQTAFDIMNIFMMQMTDPFTAGRGETAPGAMSYADDAMAYAPKRRPTDAFAAMHRKAPAPVPQERWNMWTAGFGGSQATDGNAVAGTSNSQSSIYGMAVGADYWFSPFTVAGFSMAGGGTNFSVNGGGSGRSDLFQVGGFVRHMVGSTYISAAAAYGWQDITTDRAVTVVGLDLLRARFNANSYSGRVEAGNRFALPWIGGLGVTPYGAVQVTAFDLPSYAESVVAGGNTFALSYAGKTVTATRTELGLRTDKSFVLSDAILTLRGRAAWAHDFNTDRSATATFQSLPGASFVVNGAALASNAALTTASAELKWANGWSIAGTFEGEFSDVTRSYAGKGVVRYAW